MTTTTIRHPQYHQDHLALAAASTGPAWLNDLRAAGWERFNEIGFPTARRGNERWKYTAVAPIARVNFAYPFLTTESAENTEIDFGFSTVSALSAFNGDEDKIRQHLGSLAPLDDGFTALNTAFLRDVAIVRVPDNSDVPVAVCVNHGGLSDTDERAAVRPPSSHANSSRAQQPTSLWSKPTLVPAGPRYFTNAVTEIVVAEGAQVDHYRLLNESPGSYHVGTTRVHQSRDSSLSAPLPSPWALP